MTRDTSGFWRKFPPCGPVYQQGELPLRMVGGASNTCNNDHNVGLRLTQVTTRADCPRGGCSLSVAKVYYEAYLIATGMAGIDTLP